MTTLVQLVRKIPNATLSSPLTTRPSLTEILFDDALKRSAELDRYFQQTGKTIGPLHGVPVTLKDQFNVEGVDSTLGYVGRCFKPASEDAVLVKMLKSMGAVITAKTNLPQSIMVTSRLMCHSHE